MVRSFQNTRNVVPLLELSCRTRRLAIDANVSSTYSALKSMTLKISEKLLSDNAFCQVTGYFNACVEVGPSSLSYSISTLL